jgi:preprotein translocase subunit SecD
VVSLPASLATDDVRKLLAQTGHVDIVPLPTASYGAFPSPGPQHAVPGAPLRTHEPALFTSDQFGTVARTTDASGGAAIAIALLPTGARLFADYSRAHLNEYFAIVLDGVVLVVPHVEGPATSVLTVGGLGGGASAIDSLVAILGAGWLPFPVQEVSVSVGT